MASSSPNIRADTLSNFALSTRLGRVGLMRQALFGSSTPPWQSRRASQRPANQSAPRYSLWRGPAFKPPAQDPPAAPHNFRPAPGFRSPTIPHPGARRPSPRNQLRGYRRGDFVLQQSSIGHLRPGLQRRIPNIRTTIAHSVGAGWRQGQSTALNGKSGWVTFCQRESLCPFPASRDHLLLWLDSICPTPVAPNSAGRYLKAVKAAHLDRSIQWLNEADIRHLNLFLRGVAIKFPREARKPITIVHPLDVIQFHQNPDLSLESHDGRVFHSASSFLSLRARRGGEVFPRHDRDRRLLRWRHFVPSERPLGCYFHVLLKTNHTQRTRIFYPAIEDCPACPLRLFSLLKDKSPFRTDPDDPIFVIGGFPLKRSWMLNRTRESLIAIGLPPQHPMSSKSWRAGTATASVRAGLNAGASKQLGIWASSVYLVYAHLNERDVSASLNVILGRTRPPASSKNPPARPRAQASKPPTSGAPSAPPVDSESDSDLSMPSSPSESSDSSDSEASDAPRQKAARTTFFNRHPERQPTRASARIRDPSWRLSRYSN
jgi:hypothetical protein